MQHFDKTAASGRLLQDLAYLYLAMAYGADKDLDEAELAELTRKLHARYPDLERHAIEEAAGAALTDYMDAEAPMEEAATAIVTVRDNLPEPGRRLVFEDLVRVAEADGELLPAEQKLLDVLEEGWDLED